MTPAELQIYNEAAAATIQGDRTRLARAVRLSKKFPRTNTYHYKSISLTELILHHCCFIGWPVRLRPNGRYT